METGNEIITHGVKLMQTQRQDYGGHGRINKKKRNTEDLEKIQGAERTQNLTPACC